MIKHKKPWIALVSLLVIFASFGYFFLLETFKSKLVNYVSTSPHLSVSKVSYLLPLGFQFNDLIFDQTVSIKQLEIRIALKSLFGENVIVNDISAEDVEWKPAINQKSDDQPFLLDSEKINKISDIIRLQFKKKSIVIKHMNLQNGHLIVEDHRNGVNKQLIEVDHLKLQINQSTAQSGHDFIFEGDYHIQQDSENSIRLLARGFTVVTDDRVSLMFSIDNVDQHPLIMGSAEMVNNDQIVLVGKFALRDLFAGRSDPEALPIPDFLKQKIKGVDDQLMTEFRIQSSWKDILAGKFNFSGKLFDDVQENPQE